MTLRFGTQFTHPEPISSNAIVRCLGLGGSLAMYQVDHRALVVDVTTGAVLGDEELPDEAYGSIWDPWDPDPGASNQHGVSLDNGMFILPGYTLELGLHWIPGRWSPAGFEWGAPYSGPEVSDDPFGGVLLSNGDGTFWSHATNGADNVMADFEVYDDGGVLRIRRVSPLLTFPYVDDLDFDYWLQNVSGVGVRMGGGLTFVGAATSAPYLVIVPDMPDWVDHFGVLSLDGSASAITRFDSVPLPPPRHDHGELHAPILLSQVLYDGTTIRFIYGAFAGEGDSSFTERLATVRGDSVSVEEVSPPDGVPRLLFSLFPPGGHWAVPEHRGGFRPRPGVPLRFHFGGEFPAEQGRTSVGLVTETEAGFEVVSAPPPADVGDYGPPEMFHLPGGEVVVARREDNRVVFYSFLPPAPPSPPRVLRLGSHRKRGYFT